MEALEECLQRLSQLVVDCPQIQELDINPLIVRNRGDGCAVTDARILVAGA
jgi:acetyltransferase